jgi:hypothetical protein
MASSNGSYRIGEEAVAILSRIVGVSAITIDRLVIDGVKLSYQSGGQPLDNLDQLLHAKGLRRL